MLKGHTKIELTNVKTGEKNTYEKDNFVTNLFKDAMQPCGVFGDLKTYFVNKSITAKNALLEMARGVVLFDTVLPNDPDQYTLPAGVNMVGRGTDAAYNGQDTTLGSYNASESVIDNDGSNVGYRFVWDFNTQQANGTIKSICLTPTASATIGFGKSNAVEDNNKTKLWEKELESYTTVNASTYPSYDNYSDQKDNIWMDFAKNRLLRVTGGFTGNSKTLGNLFFDKNITISEYRIPITNRSIFDSYNVTERRTMVPDKTYTVAMPAELQAICAETGVNRGFETRVDQKNGILSIILLPEAKCSIAAGGTIYAWEIDLNTMTSTVKKYTNNTGFIIGNNTAYEGTGRHCIYELNDYILIHSGNNTDTQKLCCLNKKTGESKDIKMMDGSAIPFSGTSYVFTDNYMKVGNLLIGTRRSYLDKSKITAYFIVDCVTGTLKNIEVYNLYNSLGCGSSRGEFYDYAICEGNRKYMMIQNAKSFLYPFVFFTINNLDTPIEKTSDQAMRITYELMKE